MPTGQEKVLRRRMLRLLRMTSQDATIALSILPKDELGDRITGKECSGNGCASPVHKQIAHGSARARQASVIFASTATPGKLAKHLQRGRLDRPRHHPLVHLFHRYLRQTRAMSTCPLHKVHTIQWILPKKQTAGMLLSDCKPWTEQCMQQKPTQQLQPRDSGARLPSSSLT